VHTAQTSSRVRSTGQPFTDGRGFEGDEGHEEHGAWGVREFCCRGDPETSTCRPGGSDRGRDGGRRCGHYAPVAAAPRARRIQPRDKSGAQPDGHPTASLSFSQSTADARAYGIDAAVAALPIGVRVFQRDPANGPYATSQASTPEGLWLVSRAEDSPNYDYGAHSGLLTEYGELQLLTPDRSRILRAYPFRGVPPQWLLVTPKAVYCGRQGDGGLPNSMVCRVDRSTGALIVVVFPHPECFATDAPQAFAGRPGSWRLAGSLPSADLRADLQHVPRLTADGLVFAPDPNQPGGGRALRLDPVTLK
jgi:hypothetical protein